MTAYIYKIIINLHYLNTDDIHIMHSECVQMRRPNEFVFNSMNKERTSKIITPLQLTHTRMYYLGDSSKLGIIYLYYLYALGEKHGN